MRTFELIETSSGVIIAIKISTGEIIKDWEDLADFCTDDLGPMYGEGLHQLVIGLKGAGESVHIYSRLSSGRIAKARYKKTTLVDMTAWGLGIKADQESLESIAMLENAHGDVPSSPSAIVSRSFISATPSIEVTRRKNNRPSLIEAYLCSSRLPDRGFKPAYAGGVLSSPVAPDRIFENVSSFDINSSYPYSALVTQVPVSKGVELSAESIDRLKVNSDGTVKGLAENMGFVGLFNVTNFVRKDFVRIPLLRGLDIEYIDNLVSDGVGILSGSIKIAMTNPDLKTFVMQYDFDSIEIEAMSIHKLGPIPKHAEEFILAAFDKKNRLAKDDPRRQPAKTALNTIIGFWGTDPFKAIEEKRLAGGVHVSYHEGSIKEAFDKYAGNDDEAGRVLGRPRAWDFRWATHILANARHRMAVADKTCYDFGLEVIYSDTDSIKVSGDYELAKHVFAILNAEVTAYGLGGGIGMWVDETDGYTRGVFRGHKFYVLQNDAGDRKVVIAGTKPEEATRFMASMSLETIADRNTSMVIEVSRRSPFVTKNENPLFGFNHIYPFRTTEMDYTKEN